MVTCPTCGTRNTEGSAQCSACGHRLTVPGAGTLVAGSTTAGQPPAPPAREPPAQPQVRVMASGRPTTNPGEHARAARMKQTMMGVAPAPNVGASAAVAPALRNPSAAAGEPGALAPVQQATVRARRTAPVVRQTMIGVAPAPNAPAMPENTASLADLLEPSQGVAPPERNAVGTAQSPGSTLPAVQLAPTDTAMLEERADLATSVAPPTRPSPGPNPEGAAPFRHRTRLGSPSPGYPPLGAGVGAGAPRPTPSAAESVASANPSEFAPATPKTPSQAPTLVSANATSLDRTAPTTYRRAALGVVGALGVLTVLSLVGWQFRARSPVRATVSLDPIGAEVLALTCARCADGTTASVDGTTGIFVDHNATLALGRRLAVGDNRLRLELTRVGGQTQSLELQVPVDFRLDPDLSGLSAASPVVRVSVTTTPGAAVVINGRPTAMDAAARGIAEVELVTDLTGPSASITTLTKAIPYSVTLNRTQPAEGELAVQLRVTALMVDAPGDSIVIEGPNFWLIGRTLAGGSVSVSGRPIAVAASGRFAQLMSVSAVGETTIFVRADAPQYAPRLVPLHVRRVASLREEGARLDGKVEHSYDALIKGLATAKDRAVGFAGTVIEAREDGHRSEFLLDVTTGCRAPPCLARVMYGAKASAALGASLRVYGRFERVAESSTPDRPIPQLLADFVIPSHP